MRSPKLAILVVNYNGVSALGRLFLESISSYIAEAERCGCADIWLVDNGSRDNSLEVVREEFGGRLGYIVSGANLGYGGACNLAYRYLEGRGLRYDYYVCANNDIVVFEGSLKRLVRYLHALREAFPWGFIGAPVLVNGYLGGLDFGGYYVDTSGGAWPLRLVVRRPELLLELMRGLPLPVSYADGAFMIFHKAALGKLGRPFEEKLFLYGEDVDTCLRAWSMGIPSLLLPVVLGRHYRSATTGRVRGLQVYVQVRNRLYLAYRYFGLAGLLRGLAWYLLYPFRLLGMGDPSVRSILRELGLEELPGEAAKVEVLRAVARALLDAPALAAKVEASVRRRARQRGQPPVLRLPLQAMLSEKRLLAIIQRQLKGLLAVGGHDAG